MPGSPPAHTGAKIKARPIVDAPCPGLSTTRGRGAGARPRGACPGEMQYSDEMQGRLSHDDTEAIVGL